MAQPPRTTACPHCGKTASLDASNRWRPFCSERCKLIDLGEWIEGRYSIPAEEQPQPAHRPQDDQ